MATFSSNATNIAAAELQDISTAYRRFLSIADDREVGPMPSTLGMESTDDLLHPCKSTDKNSPNGEIGPVPATSILKSIGPVMPVGNHIHASENPVEYYAKAFHEEVKYHSREPNTAQHTRMPVTGVINVITVYTDCRRLAATSSSLVCPVHEYSAWEPDYGEYWVDQYTSTARMNANTLLLPPSMLMPPPAGGWSSSDEEAERDRQHNKDSLIDGALVRAIAYSAKASHDRFGPRTHQPCGHEDDVKAKMSTDADEQTVHAVTEMLEACGSVSAHKRNTAQEGRTSRWSFRRKIKESL